MKSIKNKYILYILVRNDLISLNPGKAMAQTAHAANHLTAEWGESDETKEFSSRGNPFGTTIVLSVDKKTLLARIKIAERLDRAFPYGIVVDETYPFNTTTEIADLIPPKKLTAPTIIKDEGRVMCFRREITCGYVLVANGSSYQSELVGDLPLHP
jgi:peptidyl-tRNA hydrolase